MIQPPRPERAKPDSPARFQIGDLVRHRRYGYRGVVAGFDLECRASEAWYASNRSQPERDQPWYHVLVDGAAHTTYAAETNLEVEYDPSPVHHPLLAAYFEDFRQGGYVPNGRPFEP